MPDSDQGFRAKLREIDGTSAPTSKSPASDPTGAIIKVTPPDTGQVSEAQKALREGNLARAFELGLKTPGDKMSGQIAINASVPIEIPGTKLGVDQKGTFEVSKNDKGKYEIAVDQKLALSLGLSVTNDLKAQGDAEGGGKLVYVFNTPAEASQGVKDLAVTAGNHPAANAAASLAEDAADAAYVAGNIVGRLPIVGDRIKDLTRAAEAKTDEFKTAVGDARGRLNKALDSVEISGKVGVTANLGLPNPVEAQNLLEASGGLNAGTTYTLKKSKDGTLELSIANSAKVTGNAALAGKGFDGGVDNSITASQKFKRQPDGSYARDGDATVKFSSDGSSKVTNGKVMAAGFGSGTKVTYEVAAANLKANIGEAARSFLVGEPIGKSMQALGAIEGKLTVQGRVTADVDASAGFSFAGASLGVKGNLNVTNQGDKFEDKKVSVAELAQIVLVG